MPNPVFRLPPKWAAQEQNKIPYKSVALGDGYTVGSSIGLNGLDVSWQIDAPLLNRDEMLAADGLFRRLAGVDKFDWAPDNIAANRRAYVCDEQWTITPAGPGLYRLSATFKRYSS